MKLFLKISLFLLLPFFATAQTKQKELDSLHQTLNVAPNDSAQMSAYYYLGFYYVATNNDSAAYFFEQSFNLSKKINQPLWAARISLSKSYFLTDQGNFSLAYKLINEAMAVAQEEKNEKNLYIAKGDSSYGRPHKFRLGVVAEGFGALAGLYGWVGNDEKLIFYYKEAVRIAEESKNEGYLVYGTENIGYKYLLLNKLDSAWFYCNKALEYSNTTDQKKFQGYILDDIGEIYFKRKLLDSARHFYWQSLLASREQNNLSCEYYASYSLAQMFKSISGTDSMLYYAKNAFKNATDLKSAGQIGYSAELISSAFKMKGNADSAFAYLSVSKTIGDSINKLRKEKITQFQNINFEEQIQLEKAAQESIASKNKIRTTGLLAGLGLLSVLAFVFYRNNRQKQKANTILQTTLSNLKLTQSQLIQSEKMASLGELTAGIAHEIQNPLNFVNNFSEVNTELIDEMQQEMDKGNYDDAKAISNDIKDNEQKINHHGKRADAIVRGMLQHSRSSTGVKEPTDINALADEYLRLSYHGLRAKDKSFNATLKTDFDETIGTINIIPQDIGRVILNLINNAFYVVNEKQKAESLKLKAEGNSYEPTVTVTTKKTEDKLEIKVADNGNGIPQKIVDKIFQPFFTTKPTGQGTGLGLSLSYDIVKAHSGELKVETKESEGSEFIIQLPAN